MMERKKVIDTMISTGNFDDLKNKVLNLAENKKSAYVCFANAHMIVESHVDRHFRKIVNEADIVTPDGRPLSIFIKWYYGIDQDRVPGMDLMPALLKEAEKSGKSVYFYGSTPKVLHAIRAKIGKELPGLKIAGTYSPPFRTLNSEEKAGIVDLINESNPDLVFVALGCPKQEKWMADHKGKINAVMLGVGQAFMTYAGLEKRLPKWMRDFSLEWVYRLYLEPRRLWKRYLVTNSMFLYLSTAEFLKKIHINKT
jgi:N-acetylglucosaminyldiphosphoundecaprenol N-acetyl-beta-D-mannosaminyltransferase